MRHRFTKACVVALVSSIFVLQLACSTDAGLPLEDDIVLGAPRGIVTAPELVVGVGDEDLFGVVTPFLLPNGRLVVPERGGQIRVFEADGVPLETLGGTGAGPGEFRGITAAWPRGDTIEAYDFGLARITRFLPNGSVDVVPLRGSYPVFPAPGAASDGWILQAVRGATPTGRDHMVFVHFSRDGAAMGEIAEIAGMHRFPTPGASGPDPLSPAVRFRVALGKLYLAETFNPVIQILTSDGALEREIMWEPGPSMSPQVAFAAVLDSATRRAPPGEAEAVRQRIEAFPIRDQVPSFWDFMVDTDGFIWVQPFEPGRQSMAIIGPSRPDGEWWILSPDGERAGTVTTPEGVEMTQITMDKVVGIYRDRLGVETVRVYPLERY